MTKKMAKYAAAGYSITQMPTYYAPKIYSLYDFIASINFAFEIYLHSKPFYYRYYISFGIKVKELRTENYSFRCIVYHSDWNRDHNKHY